MKIRDILYTTLNNKCPRCHEGLVFKDSNPYNLKRIFEMHEHCGVCNLKFEKEPGYFYGAMYVAYGITAGWFVLWFILQELILNWETRHFVIFLVASLLLLGPLTFRVSRLLWISFFVPYDNTFKEHN